MPETPAPPDSGNLRPLPRRAAPRPAAARANRPRFGLLDAVWIILLAALSLGVAAHSIGFNAHNSGGLLAAAGTVIALYLLGWRIRDRAAGLGAGLLAATSLPFLHLCAAAPQSAPFMLLTVAALFAFVAGSSLAALALAVGATFVRPDGLLLGLLLVGISIAQHRRRSIYGAALFFIPILGVWSAQIALGHAHPAMPAIAFHAEPAYFLASAASLLLLWFLLPMAAEMSEPMRRARWLPVVLWAVLSMGIDLVYAPTNSAAMTLPLRAVLFALAGGGLSRLLPTLTGEFPGPALRYTLATAAVLALVGLHFRLE